jgi:ParB family chromosome partitioning protein
MNAPTQEAVLKHVDSLRPHTDNPRSKIDEKDEHVINLCDSIIEKGILEPLLITPDGLILAGHRRRVASRMAYKKTGNEKFLYLPCLERILKPGEDPLEVMLHENMQRQSLSLAEEARSFQILMDRKQTTAQGLARTLSIPVTTINSRLAIINTEPEVQALFDADLLPIGSAPWLSKVIDKEEQLKLANMVARRQITLPMLQEMVRLQKKTSKPATPRNPNHIQRSLTRNTPRSGGKKKTLLTGPSSSQIVVQPTRADAINALEGANGKSIKLFDIRVLMNSVCMACGMLDKPDVCRTCPLPRLILGIVGRSSQK